MNFLLLDGEPHSADYSEYKTSRQRPLHPLSVRSRLVICAGYAAVKDGYTKLGFLGGMAVPAVIRYGYGFVQGADARRCRAERGMTSMIKYWYCRSLSLPADDIKAKMSGWYTEGTRGCLLLRRRHLYLSACAAAEEAGAKVIGVDVDQYYRIRR